MNKAYQILGTPRAGGLLIIADHASNHVPVDIDLGINPEFLERHIAWDIGVTPVAELLCAHSGFSAILGGASRLVVDLNRYADEAAVIPQISDGIFITGNTLNTSQRSNRLRDYYHPYHEAITSIISLQRPALILSLHSFTPKLESQPDETRPWEIGVLYNQDNRAAQLAIPLLSDAGLVVGDQLPYSGKDLNATMNTHAEANAIPYLGIEMRQDMVSDFNGHERFANILANVCHKIMEKLALMPLN
jgi:predicted N-formylglutamate amidohydrolase